MTSIPASRRQRATTLAPRSWPSSPTLAINTRMGLPGMGGWTPSREARLHARGPGGAHVLRALDDRARGAIAIGRQSRECRGRGVDGARRCAEDLVDLEGQRVRREGLGEEGHARAQDAVADDGIIGIAGHVEHFHIRTQGLEPLGELAAAHLRHDDVGDHEVDGALVALADLERLDAVAGLEDIVAVHLEDLSDDRPDAQGVLDEEDGLGALRRRLGHDGRLERPCRGSNGLGLDSSRRRRDGCSGHRTGYRGRRRGTGHRRRRGGDRRGRFDLGQVDAEGRAASQLGLDRHRAAALLDDAVDRGESETRALAGLLRREERLEEVREGIRVHAGAAVADFEQDVGPGGRARGARQRRRFAGADVGGADDQPPTVRHGIAGIDGQVHDDLLDLARVGLDVPERALGHRHQVDRFPDQPLEHGLHAGHDAVQVEHLGRQHLLAAEGEQLARERGGLVGSLADAFRVLAQRMVRREAPQDQVAVAPDDHEQVVEVVRDAARELADRVHLLGLPQLILARAQGLVGALELGQVDGEAAGQLRGLTVDLTELKRADEALRASEDQLRQAQKMDAVGKLAGGIAHDFNNLLMVIRGDGDLILRRLPSTHPLRKNAEGIRDAADQAATLTRQLLAFSRKQVLAPRVLDLNSIVSGMQTMIQRLIGETINLVTVPEPALGRVKADPGQIEQVIMNLAVNARDAMPDGGRLVVRTANVRAGEAPGLAGAPSPPVGPHVLLEVTDSGTGMDAATRAHLFEPFFTTKEPGKGTGLGLSTVYGIVEQSGGSVTVETAVGHGTTFQIYLPQVETPVPVAPPARPAPTAIPPATPKFVAPAPMAAVPLRPPTPLEPVHPPAPLQPALVSETPLASTETILLVEDALRVRAVVREILEMNGYSVLEARHGAEAIEISERHRGPIQLMVTDVVMPQMSGRELAQRLQPVRPDMRVLYMSGYTDDAIVRHGVLGEGIAFLSKPFTPDALALKVREVLEAPPRTAAEVAAYGGSAAPTVGAATGPRVQRAEDLGPGRRSHV